MFNYVGLDSVVNANFLPVLVDNVFLGSNGFAARLYKKAKTFNDLEIVTQIEYDDISAARFISDMQTIPLEKKDFITNVRFQPRMLADSLLISKKQELMAKSPRAALNIVEAAMRNLEKGMQTAFSDALWTRPADVTGAEANPLAWHSIPFLVNNGTVAVGNIAPADFARWVSTVWDSTALGGDLTSETELMDPTSPVYLLTLYQRGIARTKHRASQDGRGITCLVPQYIWDLTERILDPQKAGSALDEEMGQMGFSALKYRQMLIIADDEMVRKQTGDNDGEIYFINEDFVDLWFHPEGKMQSEPFVKGTNLLAASKLFYSFGNMSIVNRLAQVKITGVRSPKDWVELGTVNTIE